VAETVRFTGSARDYFRVWIVNLFLTIVTLGLYSPWAKVRKKRYLYGHTWVAGSNFDYHGDPVAILRGRLLAFAAFVAYSVGGQFSPRAAAIILLVLLPAIPWLILRSFAFNAANSSWRNLRFGYEGRYGDALKAILPFVPIPLLTVLHPLQPDGIPDGLDIAVAATPPLLFMLFYPYMRARLVRLRLNGTSLGDGRFECAIRARSFYRVYLIASLMATGVAFVLGIVGALVAAVGFSIGRGMEFTFVAMGIAYMGIGVMVMSYTQSRIGNLTFDSTTLAGGVRFRGNLALRKLGAIYFTNLLAILLTCGLAVPWAVIRTLRYRAECVSIEAEAGLDHFHALASDRVTAAGEEMGDMFALDVSL